MSTSALSEQPYRQTSDCRRFPLTYLFDSRVYLPVLLSEQPYGQTPDCGVFPVTYLFYSRQCLPVLPVTYLFHSRVCLPVLYQNSRTDKHMSVPCDIPISQPGVPTSALSEHPYRQKPDCRVFPVSYLFYSRECLSVLCLNSRTDKHLTVERSL